MIVPEKEGVRIIGFRIRLIGLVDFSRIIGFRGYSMGDSTRGE